MNQRGRDKEAGKGGRVGWAWGMIQQCQVDDQVFWWLLRRGGIFFQLGEF